jgi:WD40 repeat protein
MGTGRLHGRPVLYAAFAPDGKSVGIADGRMRLWDPVTGKVIREFATGPTRGLTFAPGPPVVFSPDGKHVAAGGENGTLWLWDSHTGKVAHPLEGMPSAAFNFVNELAFSPDGKYLVHLANGLRRWDVTTGKEAPFQVPRSPGRAFGRGGRGAPFGGFGGEKSAFLAHFPNGHLLLLTRANFSWTRGDPEGLRPGDQLASLPDFGRIALAPDGKTLAAGLRDLPRAQLLDVATGKSRATLVGHKGRKEVTALVFSSDGKFLASAAREDTEVRVWDPVTGRLLRKLEAGRRGVFHLDFAPNARVLMGVGGLNAEGAPGMLGLTLWDVASGQEIHRPAGHRGAVTAVAFAGPRTVVSWGGDERLCTWEAQTGKKLSEQWLPQERFTTAAFAPDGKLLALREGREAPRTVHLWSVPSGDRAPAVAAGGQEGAWFPLRSESGGRVVEITSTSQKTASASRGTLSLRGPKRKPDWSTELRDEWPECLAFSADEKLLACGGSAGVVRVFEAATGREVSSFKGHQGAIRSLAFAPSGGLLVSGSADHTLLVWRLPAR